MRLIQGDCLEVLKTLPDNSVDAVVTDPPYGLKFMGKKWDYEVPSVETWREVMRVLKHGGHALVACGTRTQHRMALNIEDAGFEIRDVITWMYGSGFPKSLDVSKAIDKSAGAEREVLGQADRKASLGSGGRYGESNFSEVPSITAPSTDEAKQWQGWGTALKPACEFWTLARKPLAEKTVAANVLKYGTGAINVDGCRVTTDEKLSSGRHNTGDQQGPSGYKTTNRTEYEQNTQGRFPANLILDEQAAFMLDEQTGELKSGAFKQKGLSANTEQPTGWKTGNRNGNEWASSSGGASRFFYCAKASKSERNAGLEGMPEKVCQAKQQNSKGRMENGIVTNERPSEPKNQNHHPTVKPIKLMQYLCRLITPPNGIVLDPFMGSGSTGVAAKNEGFDFIGIEREKEYKEIAEKRIEAVML